MAKWHTIQDDFTGGEVSPLFVSRVADEQIRKSLLRCRNAIPLVQGTVITRPGTEFIRDVTDISTPNSRIWTLLNEGNDPVLALFKDSEVNVVSDAITTRAVRFGNSISTRAIEGVQIIPDPVFANGIGKWSVDGAKNFMQGGQPGTWDSNYKSSVGGDSNRPFNGMYYTFKHATNQPPTFPQALYPRARVRVGNTQLQLTIGKNPSSTDYGFVSSADGPTFYGSLTPSVREGFNIRQIVGSAAVADKLIIKFDLISAGVTVAVRIPAYDDATYTGVTDGLNRVLIDMPGVHVFLNFNFGNLIIVELDIDDSTVEVNHTLLPITNPTDQFTVSITGVELSPLTNAGHDLKPSLLVTIVNAIGDVVLASFQFTDLLTSPQITSTQSQLLTTPGFTGNVYILTELYFGGLLASYGSDSLPAGKTTGICLTSINIYADGADISVPSSLVTPYADEELDDLQFIQSPFDERELIIFSLVEPPQALFENIGVWTITDYTFVSPPTEWNDNNFVTICASFQGRLVVSGAPETPETIWASKTFLWKDFSEQATPVPDDAVTFTPIERNVNTWLFGFKRLLFGTRTNEHSVDPQSGVLQPSDIAVKQQSSVGAARSPQKLNIDNTIAYAAFSGTALQMMMFTEEGGGFQTNRMTYFASHLFKSGIRRLGFTRDYQEMVWCLLRDGNVAIMTYSLQFKVFGWALQNFGDRVIDLHTYKTVDGVDVVLLLVERLINGIQRRYIERITDLRDTDLWRTMDCHITRIVDPTTNIITGLELLEGRQVDVFAGEEYEGRKTVIGGTISVTPGSTIYTIGLAYTFKLMTVPQPSAIPEQGLTSKKRYSKIGVRVVATLPPIINGKRPPDRSVATPMDTSEDALPYESFDVTDMEWTEDAVITVEENLPFQCAITGIYGKLTSNEI